MLVLDHSYSIFPSIGRNLVFPSPYCCQLYICILQVSSGELRGCACIFYDRAFLHTFKGCVSFILSVSALKGSTHLAVLCLLNIVLESILKSSAIPNCTPWFVGKYMSVATVCPIYTAFKA